MCILEECSIVQCFTMYLLYRKLFYSFFLLFFPCLCFAAFVKFTLLEFQIIMKLHQHINSLPELNILYLL